MFANRAVGCCGVQLHPLSLYLLGIQPDSASNVKGNGSGTQEKHSFIVPVILLPIELSECALRRKMSGRYESAFLLFPKCLF